MARATEPQPPADLPPVTEEHLRAAFVAMRWVGARYDYSMAIPFLRKQVECRAAIMRTAEWERTTKRTVVPVKRVRLGVDGHPIGWCTQMVPGPRVDVRQVDFLNHPEGTTPT